MSEKIVTDEFKSWQYPYIEEPKQDEGKTNALNRHSEWKYEPPEEEEEILPPTAEEIEAIRTAAYEEGFAQGLGEGTEQGVQQGMAQGHEEGLKQGKEQGFQEGYQQGAQQIAEQTEMWKLLNGALQNPIATVEQELQKELVVLAVSLAKSVIRSEVQTNQDMVFRALSEGLKVLPIQEKQYQIRVHPTDMILIQQHFTPEEIANHNWLLIEAPELSPGGCEISTENNAVDVSIEKRMRDVFDRFVLEQGLSSDIKSGLDSE